MKFRLRKDFSTTLRCAAVALGVLTGLGSVETARAEGSRNDWRGAWGVNRVIRTNGNYSAVEGTAAIWFKMPAEQDRGVIATTRRTNPYDNKPSAYLGAGRVNAQGVPEIEADAGLQYETNDWRDYLALYGVNEGWAAFISQAQGGNTAQYTNPRTWNRYPNLVTAANPDGGVWEAWRGGRQNAGEASITSSLRFDVMSGGAARLRVGNFNRLTNEQNPNEPNAFFWNSTSTDPLPVHRYDGGYLIWPWVGIAVFDTSVGAMARTSVKRVVAMTRANEGNTSGAAPGNDELDGSEMSVAFTICRVARVGDTLTDWTNAHVDQVRTGYDAQPDLLNGNINHQAYDRRSPWTPLTGRLVPFASRTVVTFGPGNTLTDAAARTYNTNARADSADGRYPARYRDETVRIFLGTATRLSGEKLQSGAAP